METLVVKDLDSAVDMLIAYYSSDFEYSKIKFSNELNLKIKLQGSQWDGKIDYNIAEFVIKLQKEFLKIYNQQNGTNYRYLTSSIEDNNLKIKVTIEKGSTNLNIDLAGVLANMAPDQVLSCALIIASTYGVIRIAGIIKEYLQSKKAIEKDIVMKQLENDKEIQLEKIRQQENESTRNILGSQIEKLYEVTKNSMSLLNNLVRPMEKEDSITINDNLNFKAPSAKKIFRKTPLNLDDEDEAKRFFVDDDYLVYHIDRQHDDCTIMLGNKKRKISLSFLTPPKRTLFYSECSKKEEDTALTAIKLQITVLLKGGVFKGGFIQDVQENKRENAMRYEDAVIKSINEQEQIDEQEEQEEQNALDNMEDKE